MHDFLIKKITETDFDKELKYIGFDETYINKAKYKFKYINFKIFDLNCAQANILKQTALSVGADCATNKEVITGRVDKSDVILGGSVAQLTKIAEKLQFQPFSLKILGQRISELLNVDKKKRTQIIGVLNVTENSFSDGGQFRDFNSAVKQLEKLIDDGADIIDIGAESTKPGAKEVNSSEQLKYLLPILDFVNDNNIKTPISIDTRNSVVAEECINSGAKIINDVSGFDYDSNMVNVISNNPGTKIIIQHSQGLPENMQENPYYSHLMDDIYKSLDSKIKTALDNGIKKENIIIDPGIGFGKTREDNFEIIRKWQEFRTLNCPVLLGISRKSLLNMNNADNSEKDLYTLALNSILISQNIDYIRVHNVKIHKKFLDIYSVL